MRDVMLGTGGFSRVWAALPGRACCISDRWVRLAGRSWRARKMNDRKTATPETNEPTAARSESDIDAPHRTRHRDYERGLSLCRKVRNGSKTHSLFAPFEQISMPARL